MANYVKATNFTAKDGLPSGNAGKIIKGSEIDIEFTAIASAVSSKADINSPALTGTPTAPTAIAGTATTQLATTAFVTSALSAAYPIGSIYINASSSSNPNVLLGFGTWEAFGAGRVLVGFDSADALFDTLEETGGSKNAVNVSHNHTVSTTLTDPGHDHEIYPRFYGAFAGEGDFIQPASTFTGNRTRSTGTRTTGITATTTMESAGVSGTNANIQPYITVRMWKRTA
jgi:hypothetical protein